jgi:hypothetical protein
MTSFKEWLKLKEVGTFAAAIAPFARPIGSGEIVRRTMPSVDKPKQKKKKKYDL